MLCARCWRPSSRRGGQARVSLLLKIAPDLEEHAMDDIAAVVLESGIEGLIVIEHHYIAAALAEEPLCLRNRRALRPASVRHVDEDAGGYARASG